MNLDRELPDVEAAAAALAAGEVVLMPTDTLPGLHGRADYPDALDRLAALKGRPAGKSFLVLAGSLAQARSLVAPLAGPRLAFVEQCWPGPFSLILPARDGLPAAIRHPAGTVAVRVPDLAWLRNLALAAGAPLASSSANRAGELPATDLKAAVAIFGSQVAVFGGPAASVAAGRPSALVDVTVWPPRVQRPGPIPVPEVRGEP